MCIYPRIYTTERGFGIKWENGWGGFGRFQRIFLLKCPNFKQKNPKNPLESAESTLSVLPLYPFFPNEKLLECGFQNAECIDIQRIPHSEIHIPKSFIFVLSKFLTKRRVPHWSSASFSRVSYWKCALDLVPPCRFWLR